MPVIFPPGYCSEDTNFALIGYVTVAKTTGYLFFFVALAQPGMIELRWQ